MHLPFVLSLVAILIYSKEVGEPQNLRSTLNGFVSILLIPIPWILSTCYSVARMSSLTSKQIGKIANRSERIHLIIGITVVALIYGPLAWPQFIRFYLGFDKSILIDEILLLLPMLTFGLSAIVLVFLNDRRISNNRKDKAALDLRSYLAMQAKHSLLLPLLPVVGVLLISDLANQFEFVAAYDRFLLILFLGMTPLLLPWVLRHLWDLDPLPPGAIQQQVDEVMKLAKVRVSEVCIWYSKRHIANAAVSGIVPWLRYLFLSDGLLDRCSAAEVRAIVAHEVAHIQKKHLLRTLASVSIPFLLSGVLLQVAKDQGIPLSAAQESLLIVVLLLVWLFFHRFYARFMEYQADVDACRLLSVDSNGSNHVSIDAVHVMATSLKKLAPKGAHTGEDWWHPSIEKRLELIHACASDEERLNQFEQQTETFHRSVISCVTFLGFVLAGLILIQ